MTSSTGCSGFTLLGSPPSRAMPSRIAARSTTAGTPVKSWSSTRAGANEISFCAALFTSHRASDSTSAGFTNRPSSWRSRFSSRIFSEKGRRAISGNHARSSAGRLKIWNVRSPTDSGVRVLKLSTLDMNVLRPKPHRITSSEGSLRDGSRQVGVAHQETIDAARTAQALGNRPHNQRLAALHVARGEDAGHAGHPVGVAAHGASLGERNAKRVEQAAALRSEEAHRQQDEIGAQSERAVRHGAHLEAPVLPHRLHFDAVQGADAAVFARSEEHT